MDKEALKKHIDELSDESLIWVYDNAKRSHTSVYCNLSEIDTTVALAFLMSKLFSDNIDKGIKVLFASAMALEILKREQEGEKK